MTLLTCDPGVRACHFACFTEEDELYSVTEMSKEIIQRTGIYGFYDELVIEIPEVYPGLNSTPPKDVVNVARAAQRVIDKTNFDQLFEYYPRKWKGQAKKPSHHFRIWKALTDKERRVIADYTNKSCQEILEYIDKACTILATEGKVRCYSWKAHNIFDAVGLGLFHLERIRK